jgi:hypothetical protein
MVTRSMIVRMNIIKVSWGSPREVDNARLTIGGADDLPIIWQGCQIGNLSSRLSLSLMLISSGL